MFSSKNYSIDNSERYEEVIEKYENVACRSDSPEIKISRNKNNKRKENVLPPINSSKSNHDRPENKKKRNISSKRDTDYAMEYFQNKGGNGVQRKCETARNDKYV